jgi:NADH:ubiquinone oxidoreductase subunit C
MKHLYKIPSSWLIYKYTILYLYSFLRLYIQKAYFHDNKLIFLIPTRYLTDLLYFFKTHSNLKFSNLVELTIRDNPGNLYRFLITYVLSSRWLNVTCLVSSYMEDHSSTPSINPLFKTAHWFENEVWEFFGIYFYLRGNCRGEGNTFKQRRLLTDYGFKGYPLRKDFPLTGFFELTYVPSVGRFESLNQGKSLYLESLSRITNSTPVNPYL